MSKETARELLDAMCSSKDCDCVESQLLSRILKVLALVEPISRDAVPAAPLARRVLDILNGEEA